MSEIRFYGDPNWITEREARALVGRVANMVTGDSSAFWVATDNREGYKYQLGTGNDWKMDRDIRTGEWILFYRYGSGRLNEMAAVRATILWLFNLEQYNKEALVQDETLEYVVHDPTGISGVFTTLAEAQFALRNQAVEWMAQGYTTMKLGLNLYTLIQEGRVAGYLSLSTRPLPIQPQAAAADVPPPPPAKRTTARSSKP